MTNLRAVKNVTAIVSAARAAVLKNSDAAAEKAVSVIVVKLASAHASRLSVARSRKSSAAGPRAKAVDKRRFSDRAAFVQNATVRLDSDVARYFKSSEDVNAALRMVIALTKTVKAEEAPAKIEDDQPQAIEAAAETDDGEE